MAGLGGDEGLAESLGALVDGEAHGLEGAGIGVLGGKLIKLLEGVD